MLKIMVFLKSRTNIRYIHKERRRRKLSLSFPKAEKLTLRIADILQDNEDKTLYISKSLSDGLIRKTNANEVSSPK